MNEYEVIGIVVVVGLSALATLIGIVVKLGKPILDLNKSITELTMAIKELFRDNKRHDEELKEHRDQLNDHEKRIYLLENEEVDKDD